MLYPFMTLPDGTEIVHSESIMEDDIEKVKVVIEQPVDFGFKSAVCWLPDYQWENVEGFTSEEIAELQALIESLAHVIFELARDGGFEKKTQGTALCVQRNQHAEPSLALIIPNS